MTDEKHPLCTHGCEAGKLESKLRAAQAENRNLAFRLWQERTVNEGLRKEMESNLAGLVRAEMKRQETNQ